jgi:hypothetical protein
MIDDRDAAGPNRNVRGPNIVRRLPRTGWPTYMHRIEDALVAQGVSSHANVYEAEGDGFFPTPLSQDHERATSARCYLTAEARARPNLEIMCETRVLRVLFEGQRVTGILAERAGARKTIAAREVVISAGGIHSPPCCCVRVSAQPRICASSVSPSSPIGAASAATIKIIRSYISRCRSSRERGWRHPRSITS